MTPSGTTPRPSRGSPEEEHAEPQRPRNDWTRRSASTPSFAYAHLKKAEILQWRRRSGYGDADPIPAIRAALSLSGRLPERERLLVQILANEFGRHDTEAAIDSFQTLVARYPYFAEEV